MQIYDLIPDEAEIMKHRMACLILGVVKIPADDEPTETGHPPRRRKSVALIGFDRKVVEKSREAKEAGNQRWTYIETAPEAL
ncbi:hypothetical protein OESDEN_05757 [Oesophagostomum dentatum]|uniref:Uncharacterized protein n=1 Tax=Oesophagostomum dentatum TaxID=61180 RepID=A0A0B1TFY2_OESDE|nr:hypothetical protein OESDEN_05757 [Oesophagostomum dentatum]